LLQTGISDMNEYDLTCILAEVRAIRAAVKKLQAGVSDIRATQLAILERLAPPEPAEEDSADE
jgi:hypothetical protein